MKQLFYSKKSRRYFYVCSQDDLIVKCDKCGTIIELGDYVFIHKSYSRSEFIKRLYCRACVKKHRKMILDEFIIAQVSDYIQDDTILINDNPVTLTNSKNDTVFSMAIKDIEGVEIIDKTKLTGRESLEGATIGVMPEQREPLTNEKQVKVFLNSIKKLENKIGE